MSELVPHLTGGLSEKIKWAEVMAPSTLLPKQYQRNPANLVFAIEYADALGIERVNALTSIHVVEGKPTASADLIAGLVRRAGHKLRISGDDQSATAQLIRADDPDFIYEAVWTMDRARTAKLAGKGVWQSYPGAMLRARAITEVARMGASDALLGVVYTPEELGAEVGADGSPRDPRPLAPASSGGRQAVADALRPAAPAPEVVDAELVEEPGEELRSEEQSKRMFAGLRSLGVTSRDDCLDYVSGIAGRVVESSKTLTRVEAGRVIDAAEAQLRERAEGGDSL